MTPKKQAAKSTRTAPAETDQKTLSAGERPEATTAESTTTSGRKPWKKKSVAETILGQLDKLRQEVAEKEQAYLQAKKQLEKLEALRDVLESS